MTLFVQTFLFRKYPEYYWTVDEITEKVKDKRKHRKGRKMPNVENVRDMGRRLFRNYRGNIIEDKRRL